MRQIILFIVLIAAITLTVVFLYQYFVGTTKTDTGVSVGIQAEKLSEYRQIKNLKPDLSIFTDPFFKSLFSPAQTFGTATPLSSITPGRANPFVPF